MFEVLQVSPPPESLGVYSLPPKTHNGDQLEIEGEAYVVTALVLQYKLRRGRYVREHNRLEVQRTGRFLYNTFLDNMMAATPRREDLGKQD